MDEYQAYLLKIESELSKQDYSCTIGDFNANISSSSHRFGRELVSYCHSENLVISDKEFAPPDTFIYISEAHSTVGWLDHAVCTANMHRSIQQIWVDSSFISSDHFPLMMTLNKGNIKPLRYHNKLKHGKEKTDKVE